MSMPTIPTTGSPHQPAARPASTIQLATLDIAGTTIAEGGAVYRVLAQIVAEHRSPAPEAEIRRWMGADKRQALAALTGGDPDTVEELHTRFVEHLARAYRQEPPQPQPGVVAALARFREAGIKVVLTTGFDRQVTDPLLASVGWSVPDQLDGVVCASEVAAGRPRPDMILRAMELTGVTDPRAVLAAGDTALDIQAGHAAGAGMVVGVLSGAQTEVELAAEKPTHLLPGVAQIPEALGL